VFALRGWNPFGTMQRFWRGGVAWGRGARPVLLGFEALGGGAVATAGRRRVRLACEVLERREVPTVSVTNPGNQSSYDSNTINLGISASDSESNPLDYSVTGLPPGLDINKDTGAITGTISNTANTNSPYSVSVTVTDMTTSEYDTANFSWAVHYPVCMTNPGNQTNYAGGAVSLSISASDAVGGTLTYSVGTLPSGLSINSSTGVISGTIDTGANNGSPYSVTITAGDGTFSASRSISWTVNPYPVTVTNPGSKSNYVTDAASFSISASDATSGTLSYSTSGLPCGLSVNASTGVVSGTIGSGAATHSPYSVIVTAGDGTYSASQTFTWTVNPYPVSVTNPGSKSNYVSDAVSLSISASDATSGTLSYSASGLPSDLSINSSTGVITGTLGSGATTSSPYSVTVTAGDGTYSASQTFTWTINPYPLVLASVATKYNVNGESTSFSLSASDATSGTKVFSATGLPSGYSINSSTGEVSGTFDEDADASSPYFIVFTVSDGTYVASTPFTWVVSQQAPQTVNWTVSTLSDQSAIDATDPNWGPVVDLNGNISLRSAIQAGNALPAGSIINIDFDNSLSGTITLSTALPRLSSNFDITGPVSIDITVARSSAANTDSFPIFKIFSGSCTITNLAITNGNGHDLQAGGAQGGGGAIQCRIGTTVDLTNLNVYGNRGDFGGAINADLGSTLVMANCQVYQNTAEAAGGALCNLGNAMIFSSAFYVNNCTGGGGGGAIFNTGTMTLEFSDVYSNWVEGGVRSGGGINNLGGTFTMDGGTLYNNQATDFGGGLYNANSGSSTLTGVTITDNRVVATPFGGYFGGGVFVSSGTTTLNSLLIANNLVGGPAGSAGGRNAGATLNTNNLAEGSNGEFSVYP
jgi:hypothetical protein